MRMNYFSFVCFLWALIGICSRVIIKKLGARWRDWEQNKAYADQRPKWLIFVDIIALAAIAFTWYMVWVSDIRASWIIAALMTLILIKAMLQLYKYDTFKAFVTKAMNDAKLFSKINIAVAVFSICLIGLGIFYLL